MLSRALRLFPPPLSLAREDRMRASQRRAGGLVPELSCRRDRNRETRSCYRDTRITACAHLHPPVQHALALARSFVRWLVLSRPPIVEVHRECIRVCVPRESNNSRCLENNSNCLRENLLFALLRRRLARDFRYLPSERDKEQEPMMDNGIGRVGKSARGS